MTEKRKYLTFVRNNVELSKKYNMQYTTKVSSPNGMYEFNFLTHKSMSENNQRIEPDFYIEWNKSLHSGEHSEIQIVSDYLLDNELYKRGEVRPSLLHIHCSKKYPDEHYLCWTGKLEDEGSILKLLRYWSLGTVFTLLLKKDFLRVFSENGIFIEDHNRFYTFLKSVYGIEDCSQKRGF